MRSLRSLCLLKVQSLALGQQMLDMTEIPPSLAKDLKIMQLVNTSFEILCRDRFCGRDNVTQTALSIQYDGVFWNFCYRTRTNYKQQFTLEEGKPTPTQSPFWEASNLLEQLDQKASVNLRMIMNFEMNENEEGTWGELSFGGSEDFAVVPVVFSSSMVVEMDTAGKRKFNCDGFLGRGRVWKGFEVLQDLKLPTLFDGFSVETSGT